MKKSILAALLCAILFTGAGCAVSEKAAQRAREKSEQERTEFRLKTTGTTTIPMVSVDVAQGWKTVDVWDISMDVPADYKVVPPREESADYFIWPPDEKKSIVISRVTSPRICVNIPKNRSLPCKEEDYENITVDQAYINRKDGLYLDTRKGIKNSVTAVQGKEALLWNNSDSNISLEFVHKGTLYGIRMDEANTYLIDGKPAILKMFETIKLK